MNKILIGIDPDVDKSGYSCLSRIKFDAEPREELKIHKLKFFEIFDSLNTLKKIEQLSFVSKVYIEAGWLNKKSNWHSPGQGEHIASRIGKNVGANHQVGKLIAEMCEYLGLEYELVQPTTSKFSIRQFRMMTDYKGKLDQDMVDSALLVWKRV